MKEEIKEGMIKIDFGEVTPRQVGEIFRERALLLIQAMDKNLKGVPTKVIYELLKFIEKAKRIFVDGAGRSGNVGKSLTMRLLHLGYSVHMVGEASTPAIKPEDLFIVISGSGETPTIVTLTKIAKNVGASIVALTANIGSEIAQAADLVIHIYGKEIIEREGETSESNKTIDWDARQLQGKSDNTMPLGTVSEDSVQIFVDAVIDVMIILKRVSEDAMREQHSNME